MTVPIPMRVGVAYLFGRLLGWAFCKVFGSRLMS